MEQFMQRVKNSVKSGTVDELVKEVVSEKDNLNKEYLKKFSLIRKILRKDSGYEESLKRLFYAHSLDEFSYEQLQDIYKFKFPVHQASSFNINLIRRSRMRQLGNVPEKWLTYSKESGNQFAEMLKVKCPKTKYHVKFEDIKPSIDIVIKPCVGRGSRGVYLAGDKIISLSDGQTLNDWNELKEKITKEMETGIISSNDFIVQECIYGENKTPPRDLKFHMFYGELGAMFEVLRYPEKKDWWWSADGKLLDTGWHWYDKKGAESDCEGYGFTEKQLEIAKRISLEIPCPYIRIDFLKGDDIYFDEFCTMQGNIGSLNEATDTLFGKMYLKAEMRIMNDLQNGKRFRRINKFNKEWEMRINKGKPRN